MDVDVAGGRFPEPRFDLLRPEDRTPFETLLAIEFEELMSNHMAQSLKGERRVPGSGSEEKENGTPPDQGYVGEPRRRALEKGPGCGAEGLDDRATDRIGIVGCRSSGTVIARLVFPLDDHHAAGWRKAPGKRRSHHPCANDDDIECGHGSKKGPAEWCRRGDSNSRPTDYESVALPLSYFGLGHPVRAGNLVTSRCQGQCRKLTTESPVRPVPAMPGPGPGFPPRRPDCARPWNRNVRNRHRLHAMSG